MNIEPVNFRGADLRGAKNLVEFTPTTPTEKRTARYHRATDKIFLRSALHAELWVSAALVSLRRESVWEAEVAPESSAVMMG
jgi:hypothetical protein